MTGVAEISNAGSSTIDAGQLVGQSLAAGLDRVAADEAAAAGHVDEVESGRTAAPGSAATRKPTYVSMAPARSGRRAEQRSASAPWMYEPPRTTRGSLSP